MHRALFQFDSNKQQQTVYTLDAMFLSSTLRAFIQFTHTFSLGFPLTLTVRCTGSSWCMSMCLYFFFPRYSFICPIQKTKNLVFVPLVTDMTATGLDVS